MKRLIKIVLVTIVTGIACLSSIGGCPETYFHSFFNHVRAKESFVYVIAQDGNNWTETKRKVWNKITDPTSDESWTKQIQKPNYQTQNLFINPASSGGKKYTQMKFYQRTIDKKDDVWGDKAVKKIIKYVITKTEEHRSRKGLKVKNLTRTEIGISSTPLFLFFSEGDYQGYFQGSIKLISQNKENEKPNNYSLMYLIVRHIVYFQWKLG